MFPGNIGGICGVFIGFSLISAVEVVYFIVLSSATLWVSTAKSKSTDDNLDGSRILNDVRPLYWAELAPSGKTTTHVDVHRIRHAFEGSDKRLTPQKAFRNELSGH